MTPQPSFINPLRPRAPYRIPAAKETTRLAGQWKALSGLAKVGIVTGGFDPGGSRGFRQPPDFDAELSGAEARERERYRIRPHR